MNACAWKFPSGGRRRPADLAGPRAALAAAGAFAALAASAAELPRYELDATLSPADHGLAVDALIEVPARLAGGPVEFLLTSSLALDDASVPVETLGEAGADGFQGINGSSVELARRAGVRRYRATLPAGESRFTLRYSGTIDFALETQGEEYTRAFKETPGVVGEQGVYLAGSTLWYPYLGDGLLSFALEAAVPAGWHLVSQGDGTSRDPGGVARWDSAGAVDEIYLVGGPLVRYAEAAGAARAEVYLREPDDALARRYLDATARNIEMYRGLIGPYPYGKFALVENFWETGYGMPSFTLLGPQVIRFPFILTSSYPHEILHNWWGNSVFVDYATGNWAEGLTAYLADHLYKEQQGAGAVYRRDTLKKYRDFVRADSDFPLTEFRSRHSAATEAIGYGKTLMGFHMLRRRLGDDAFREALARFYRAERGRRAGFADLREQFEAVSGENLGAFFADWVTRTGAARLALEKVRVRPRGDGFVVQGILAQAQDEAPFALTVPIAVTTVDGLVDTEIEVDGRRQRFEIVTDRRPLALAADPAFDLFRLLDARETAPSIGQLFGERELVAVLPGAAPQAVRAAYRALVESWQSPAQRIEIVLDTDIERLPENRGAWLLGRDNRLARAVFGRGGLADLAAGDEAWTVAGTRVPVAGHAIVAVERHPATAEKAVGWIAGDEPAAFPGLARKLPHYGKYSYLAFAGDEPANVLKGEWAATDSPLVVDLRPDDARPGALVLAALPPREPLAKLPPLFSTAKLGAHVEYLAGPALEGRGLGSEGLEQAAVYIEAQFRAAGLAPGGDDGGFLQTFTVDVGPDGGPHTVHNVIGYVPGTGAELASEAVLVTAHYDHLGRGWPDERAQAAPGAVYAGADDNASGVAVLIELARAYASAPAPRRMVFVALTAEEAGLLGSAWYVDHPRPLPLERIIGMINLDTVGRLGDQPVQVLGTESATEWPHVFRGVGFTTGIATRNVPGASAASDQQSFIDAGVPGVQIFTGAHLDYHRPSDTADKVDVDGMVRVATVVREAADYLAARTGPLTATGAGVGARTAAATGDSTQGNRRRVAFGTVPAFGWPGPGIKVESVVPGSPAEAAGIRAGDTITALDGAAVDDLAGFSALLKRYEPGDQVSASGHRDDANFEVTLTLDAR